MKIIDARGKNCPLPLVMTKKALLESREDETILIIIDNDISLKNVSRFLKDQDMQIQVEKKEDAYHLMVTKTGTIPENIDAEAYCYPEGTENKNYVMVFKQDKVGHGAGELGDILIKGFVNTLPEITHKPGFLVFLNTGIHLTTKDSDVLEALQLLEKKGVKILVCGTCLDYFNKKDDIAVGEISNMYDILECITQAAKVIHP